MKVSIKAGVFGFEANISEFCNVVRDFVGAKLDEKARQALRNMIEEVDKDFELVVDVMTPLYGINSPSDLRVLWPEILPKFMNEYFTKWHSLSTHCGIVTDHLQRIQKAQNWKRNIPLLRNGVQKLDEMGQRWMCDDAKLYQAMDGFMQSINTALLEINALRKTPVKALNKLQKALNGTEAGLLKIKAYSNELKRISAQL